jgi:GNAT superfamily N-acetyltransferase
LFSIKSSGTHNCLKERGQAKFGYGWFLPVRFRAPTVKAGGGYNPVNSDPVTLSHPGLLWQDELPGSSDGGANVSIAQPQILARHDLSIADVDYLEDRLYEHNSRATGSDDGQRLGFAAVDAHGAQIGAIAGYTWAGMAEIKQLWVDEAHRGKGLGKKLLHAAVTEATARGCRVVWVASYDFQAPRFYEKFGFDRQAELTDCPPGHAHVILRRRLRDLTSAGPHVAMPR